MIPMKKMTNLPTKIITLIKGLITHGNPANLGPYIAVINYEN